MSASRSYNRNMSPSDPDELLCYCTRMTWGQILVVAQETLDFERVVRQSGACTGCGSCESQVQELVDQVRQVAGLQP